VTGLRALAALLRPTAPPSAGWRPGAPLLRQDFAVCLRCGQQYLKSVLNPTCACTDRNGGLS